jgi:hypothetical protein
MSQNFNRNTIVLIGLEEKMIQYISDHLSLKNRIIAINEDFTIKQLSSYLDIIIFLVNTDQVKMNVGLLLSNIKNDVRYHNIPVIGLSLKQHYCEFPPENRKYCEDIVLMPCGGEDLLQRISLWTNTYKIVQNNDFDTKTYSTSKV